MISKRAKFALVLIALIGGFAIALLVWRPWYTGSATTDSVHGHEENAPAATGPWRIRVNGAEEAVAKAGVVLATTSGEWAKANMVSPGAFQSPVSRESVERVLAVAPGFRSASVEPKKSGGDVILELAPSAELTVRVQDANGNAVEGAQLTVALADLADSSAWARAVEMGLGLKLAETLTTDSAGVSRLPALLPGAWIRVIAQNDWGVAEAEIASLGDRDSMTLVLRDGGTRVTLYCKRLDGSLAAGLALQYEMLAGTPQQPKRAGSSACSTDATGAARVFLSEADAVYFTGIEAGWRFQETPLVLSKERLETTVTVLREFPLDIRISYDDSRPFRDLASISTTSREWKAIAEEQVIPIRKREGKGGKGGFALPRRPAPGYGALGVDVTGQFTLPQVTEGEIIQIRANPEGIEYNQLHAKLVVTEAYADKTWEIVIQKAPKDRRSPVIRLSGPGSETGMVDIIDDPHGNVVESFSLAEKKESQGLSPRNYKVRVSSDAVGWESEVFALGNGETKELFIPISSPGKVRVQIIDKEGNALEGGSITPLSRRHATFPLGSQPFIFAISDEGGVAVLGGQPVGLREFRIEAPGMQFRIETANILANEVADLGRVSLVHATGEIRVVVEGEIGPRDRLEAKLRTPTGPLGTRTPSSKIAMDNGRASVNGLVVERYYIVSLYHVDSTGKQIGQKHINGVQLTLEKSSQEFVVKLSEFDYD